jgi:hypothetical protein
MRDSYDSGSLFPILAIAVVFAVAKLSAKLGMLTSKNADTVSKVLAVIGGLSYALAFEIVRSFGPVIDLAIRILMGGVVAGALWLLLLVGIGGATSDDREEK